MPRRDGHTPERRRAKHRGHRMHRRGRVVRQRLARMGRGRDQRGFDRWAA